MFQVLVQDLRVFLQALRSASLHKSEMELETVNMKSHLIEVHCYFQFIQSHLYPLSNHANSVFTFAGTVSMMDQNAAKQNLTLETWNPRNYPKGAKNYLVFLKKKVKSPYVGGLRSKISHFDCGGRVSTWVWKMICFGLKQGEDLKKERHTLAKNFKDDTLSHHSSPDR